MISHHPSFQTLILCLQLIRHHPSYWTPLICHHQISYLCWIPPPLSLSCQCFNLLLSQNLCGKQQTQPATFIPYTVLIVMWHSYWIKNSFEVPQSSVGKGLWAGFARLFCCIGEVGIHCFEGNFVLLFCRNHLVIPIFSWNYGKMELCMNCCVRVM